MSERNTTCSACGSKGHDKRSANCPAKFKEYLEQLIIEGVSEYEPKEYKFAKIQDRKVYQLSKLSYDERRHHIVNKGKMLLQMTHAISTAAGCTKDAGNLRCLKEKFIPWLFLVLQ